MKYPILTVTLNPAVDKTLRLSDFKLGRDHFPQEIFWNAGGKGINVSRVLKNFKVKSMATGFAGGCSGKHLQKMLRQEKILFDFVDISQEIRTNVTVMNAKTCQTTRLLEHGPNIQENEKKAFKKKFKLLLAGCDYVVFSGRNIPGAGDSFYHELIHTAQWHQKKTVLDTSGRPLSRGLEAGPYIIKPNLREAEYILRHKLNTLSKLKNAIRFFHRKGVRIVIISLGKKGAVASDGDMCWLAAHADIRAANTVGCGDALLGGFLRAQLHAKDLRESLQIAVAAGTANAVNISPGHFTTRKVKYFAKCVKMKQL